LDIFHQIIFGENYFLKYGGETVMKKTFILIYAIMFCFVGIGFCADNFYVIPVRPKKSSWHQCRAQVTATAWKIFDCYNLAAIGKTTNDDPFTPSWRLIGGYWQWGRKGPDASQWHDTNRVNFAHGPTGPNAGDANIDAIPDWDTDSAPDNSWLDASKTANDPCPDGYRIPTSAQWEGVLANNFQSTVGTWSGSMTNYTSALNFGDKLMLPAAGFRHIDGSVIGRGQAGFYWSSTSQDRSDYAWVLDFHSDVVARTNFSLRRSGSSVRCVVE
jgi:uncharacterized protein (TIGR02145 family)